MALYTTVRDLRAYNQLEKGRFQDVVQLMYLYQLMNEQQGNREEKSVKDYTHYENTIEDVFNQYGNKDIPAETRSLMAGMLHQAQKDLEKNIGSMCYKSAEHWVNALNEGDYFLSFEFICNSLGLNVETARDRIYRVAASNRECKLRESIERKEKRRNKIKEEEA